MRAANDVLVPLAFCALEYAKYRHSTLTLKMLTGKEMTMGTTLRNSDPSKCRAAELLKVTNMKIACNCQTGVIRPWM
jgi:hypothetical protein